MLPNDGMASFSLSVLSAVDDPLETGFRERSIPTLDPFWRPVTEESDASFVPTRIDLSVFLLEPAGADPDGFELSVSPDAATFEVVEFSEVPVLGFAPSSLYLIGSCGDSFFFVSLISSEFDCEAPEALLPAPRVRSPELSNPLVACSIARWIISLELISGKTLGVGA
jgi:hypothetical protein